MDLLITCFNPNSYENEENYLGFLQKKIPVLMREKKEDEQTINNLLFKVHFERKNKHFKKNAKLNRRRLLLRL